MASAIKGDTRIAAGWIGDGSTAESRFFTQPSSSPRPTRRRSFLNIVNNQWAISTFQGIARGGSGTFAARGLGFGIAALRVDGNDYLAVHAVAKFGRSSGRAAISVRPSSNTSPTGSARIPPRTTRRPTGPRPNPIPWPLGDPVIRLKNHLIRIGAWSEERHVQAEAEVRGPPSSPRKKGGRKARHAAFGRQALGAGHVRRASMPTCRPI